MNILFLLPKFTQYCSHFFMKLYFKIMFVLMGVFILRTYVLAFNYKPFCGTDIQ